MSALLELAARVEAATGPDRELDAAIACLVLGYVQAPTRPWMYHDPADKWSRSRKPAAYTASLDAAMSLLKVVGGVETWFVTMSTGPSGDEAHVWHEGYLQDG